MTGTGAALSGAQLSLVKLVDAFGPSLMGLSLDDVRRHGFEAEFRQCRRAGLIVSAGYQTSLKAEDWLNSGAGRLALSNGGPND